MRICVLGSCRALASDEGELDLGSRKPRSVLTALAMRPGRPVPADLLADLVWGGEPPRAAHAALHSYISNLRRVLEPERPARGAASLLETTDHGYVLRVGEDAVDARVFAAEARAADRALAPLASQLSAGSDASWPDRTTVLTEIDRIDEALGRWAGEPYADLPDHPDVLADRAALEQLRVAAEEARLLGLLALGEHASVLATTEAATGRHPMRERLWGIHALALARGGRQAEALEALRTVREVLADELGLDPGQPLRDLEGAILRQEPALGARLPAPDREPPSSPPSPHLPPPPTSEAGAAPAPVGRDDERRRLQGLLERATAATPAFALVVGEPGIGKTRLLEDLAASAGRAGFVVAGGRCSQDDGAPPLWPWRAVLDALGAGEGLVEDVAAGPELTAFRTWDRIVSAVVAAAAERPVLVVLDDLHWADEATLRTLGHLVTTAPTPLRLVVVATRRIHPEPTGALAAVGEAFARRHGERVDLLGLDRRSAGELLARVATDVPEQVLDRWHARSGGNPFFLVELARLGEHDGSTVPATVRDVVTRRLEALPERALETLRLGAVAGRRFRAATVAAAGALDLDDVVDDLEAARAADLLLEVGAEEYAFTHALGRDAVYLALSETRRARRHAQVARALAHDEGLRRLFRTEELTAELARHWLAAGPSHVDTAWRAAREAAAQARALSAYQEALALRLDAVAAHRRVAGTREEDRYELLLEVATDAAYAAHWQPVVDASFEAMALGRALGSPAMVARAATKITQYVVWTPHEWGEVWEDAIDDLRWALVHADDADHDTRCRVQMALAVELYYDEGATAERRALVAEGMALARRSPDPALRWWASRASWIASWRPSLTVERHADAELGLAAAREMGDPAAEAVSLLALAIDHLELGRLDRWTELSREAERIADRERLPYVQFTMHWVESTLSAMRGDAEELARRVGGIREAQGRVALPTAEIQAEAALGMATIWQPEQLAAVLDLMVAVSADAPLAWSALHAMVARCGRLDQLRELLVSQPYSEGGEGWQTLSSWSFEAEAASVAGDVRLAEEARRRLAAYEGRMALGGIAIAIGPLDGYLALAVATLGHTAEATRLADRAAAQAQEWALPVYTAWLAGHRERLGI